MTEQELESYDYHNSTGIMNDIKNMHRFTALRILISAAALMVIVAGFKSAQSFLVPFVFALFFAVLGSPAVHWLKSRGVPKVISVLLVAAVMLSILAVVGTVLARSANEFSAALPRYTTRFSSLAAQLGAWLESYGLESPLSEMFGGLSAKSLMDMIGTTVRALVSALSSTLMVVIMLLFMLFEAADFRAKLELAFGESLNREDFSRTAADVQRYLAIKTATSVLTGVMVWLINFLWGVDFAILWGLLALVMNYIPVIGSILASVPAIILALVQFSLGGALGLGVAYMAVNIGISNLLEPVLLGRRLGLSPLIVFLSLVVWGWIWGPAGMLLSVPLTMVIRILLEHSPEFRWIAVLMDGDARPSAASDKGDGRFPQKQ